METKRKALGKGLEQLFSNERIDFDSFENNIVKEANTKDIQEIDLSLIRSNPYQPRKTFNQEALQELAESIKEHGIVQPIIVKKSIKGYELVAGERRTKAAKLAGLKTIPAIIHFIYFPFLIFYYYIRTGSNCQCFVSFFSCA